jgi:hypothetical protein
LAFFVHLKIVIYELRILQLTDFSPPYPEAEGFYQRGFELSINLIILAENCRDTSVGLGKPRPTDLNKSSLKDE